MGEGDNQGGDRCRTDVIKEISVFEEKGFGAVLEDTRTKRLSTQDIAALSEFVRDASIAWVDYVVEDFDKEGVNVANSLGFSEILLKSLIRDPAGGYEDLDVEMGVLLPAIYMEGFEVKIDPLVILIREGLILTLHSKEVKRFFRVRRYAETLLRKIPQRMPLKDRMTLLLIRIIDENNSRNFDYLRGIEAKGDELSKELADPKVSRSTVGKSIYEMKHALIVYLGGLWASVDTLNALRYGDAELITDNSKILNRINTLVSEVNSHIGLAEHLSEVLASGLEVLQSIYNNQLQILNNRMAMLVAYLTIIGTALLVPNTIATVLSSSSFELTSRDTTWYIALILASTVVSTYVAWWAVRSLGLLPKSPE
ncbi:CorA family divalent cation transporter [Methanothrix sp.]|uniref:CorA family divalent cation transporter n=1 Tax=Methanothrix sp. TaxID=90426 RepID=UPI0034E2AD9D